MAEETRKEIRDLVCPRCYRSHQLHNHYHGETVCEDGFVMSDDYPYNKKFVWIKIFPLKKEVIEILKKQEVTEWKEFRPL